MNSTLEPLLADAIAQVYYWPLRYLAWALWGLLFGGLGLLVMRLVWKSRRLRAEELESENKRLRRELADMESQLRSRA